LPFLRRIIPSSALLVAALALAVPLGATIPSAGSSEAPAEATLNQGPIEQAPAAGDDARIAERITGIFSELPGFETLTVDVKAGVVTLTGTLSDADAIARAEAIAGRVAGVVTVENAIERDLSVQQNLSALAQVRDMGSNALKALPLFAVAVAIGLAIALLGHFIAGLSSIWSRVAPNVFMADLIAGAIRLVAIIGGVVIALDMLGASALLGAVLGGAGVIGIALGFAMRDTVENYVASLMLSLRQPFRPTDHVLIDNLEGRVIRLTSRATILMTLEGNHLRIPNSQVFKAVILNYTRNPQRRFEFAMGIDGDDDARAAMALGLETLRALPFVLNDPEPTARIDALGDSNTPIIFLAWVDQRDAAWTKSRTVAITAVKDALENAGFGMPEPIYRLRLDERTGKLPLGRPGDPSDAKPAPPQRQKPAHSGEAPPPDDHDVKPEKEIEDMVNAERRSDPDQAQDLLDDACPVE
jgi:small-conductance mechanosensitive channel